MIQSKQNFLKRVPLFQKLPDKVITEISQRMGEKNFSNNEIICKEGDIGEEFFIIIEGHVEISKRGTVIATLKSGDVLGEMATVSSSKRNATVKAINDVHLLFLKKQALEIILLQYPILSFKLMGVLVKRLQAAQGDYDSMAETKEIQNLKKILLPKPDEKKCPNCLEYNPRKVVSCIYCKHNFFTSKIRVVIIPVLAIVILGVSGLIFQHFRSTFKTPRKAPEKRVPLVSVKKVHSVNTNIPIVARGKVFANKSLEIYPQMEGRVEEVHPRFKEGQFINAGEILIKIDTRNVDYNISITNNQIKTLIKEQNALGQKNDYYKKQIAIATAIVEFAEKGLKQAKSLYQQRSIGELDLYKVETNYFDRKSNLENLQELNRETNERISEYKIRLDDAKLKLQKLKTDRIESEIKAPFSGIIHHLNVAHGSIIKLNTRCVNMDETSYLKITANITMEQMYNLINSPKTFQALQKGELEIPAQIIATINNKKELIEGKLTSLAPMIDGQYIVPAVIEVEQSPQKLPLQIGSFVEVILEGKKLYNVFQLSQNWLRENDTVHVIRQGKLEIVEVGIEYRNSSLVFVNKGLQNDDFVIVTPLSLAIPDMPLQAEIVSNEE